MKHATNDEDWDDDLWEPWSEETSPLIRASLGRVLQTLKPGETLQVDVELLQAMNATSGDEYARLFIQMMETGKVVPSRSSYDNKIVV